MFFFAERLFPLLCGGWAGNIFKYPMAVCLAGTEKKDLASR